MNRFLRTTGAVVALAVVTLAAAAQPQPVADHRGRTVALAAPAQRIVSLAPHLTEIAFAAGAGEKLVGVAHFSDYPAAAQRVSRIGDAARVDLERILALKPDLILAWKSGNQAGDIARLEQLGFRVFVTEPQRLSDIPRLLRAVGELAGTTDAAHRAAAAFEHEVETLRAQHGARPAVRVFYEIWHRPLLTVNGKHMISDVIALCGGVNVFAAAPLLTPSVSLEAVLWARPEAILGGSSAVIPKHFDLQWRAHAITALKDVPVFYVAPDEIQRQTPRIAQGAKAICEALEKVRNSRQGRQERQDHQMKPQINADKRRSSHDFHALASEDDRPRRRAGWRAAFGFDRERHAPRFADRMGVLASESDELDWNQPYQTQRNRCCFSARQHPQLP
ncbi:MAG: hypothetical protein A3G24_20230 [Betaproteobacteria bacterium RIFCSPLOWO2_12_FULL_62_13]|nr:MAG: hypothetical protein A3G24_20230 [Betaproteobacteria bacterium RIFCSPLOWO2_12_FULL_62_13]